MSLIGAGLGPDEERVYRFLVGSGDASSAVVAEQLGMDPDQTAQVLDRLGETGLVSVSGAERRYAPTPPDIGLAPLLRRGTESLDRARETAVQLSDDYRAAVRRRDANQLVEVVTGVEAIRQQLRTLQLSTRSEILWFCRAGHVAMPSSENDEEFAMLERGISYRVIYEQKLLEEPGMVDDLARGLRAGELARAHPELPVRMAISDRRLALCPLVSGQHGAGEPTAALVRDSNLLTALLALFDRYWHSSSPLHATEGPGPDEISPDEISLDALASGAPVSPEERELLSLLVAGVSDKAIATRLGVSHRTVQRRVSDLLARTGAQTRMQLAWQVAERGWLAAEPPLDRVRHHRPDELPHAPQPRSRTP